MDQGVFLRHALATLAYRASKALRGASAEFAEFRASPATRTPGEILAHLGDLLDWGLAMTRDKPVYHESSPRPWEEQVARFFEALRAWDQCLASATPVAAPWERIVQGPIADALTHVGQLNLLRGMAGESVRGESYYRARIESGVVGPEQPPPPPGSEFTE